jgi:hypothetical protein
MANPVVSPVDVLQLDPQHGNLNSSSPTLAESQIRARAERANAPTVDPDLRPPNRRRCTGRRYRILRVPRHVYLRVKHRMQVR